jgi:hypothetical protein
MTFSEGKTYKLQADYYESILLQCTYVEDSIIWFVRKIPTLNADVTDLVSYKLNKKTNKLYRLNVAFSSWDTVENTLSEYTADDIWSKRAGNQSYSYDGMNQGD